MFSIKKNVLYIDKLKMSLFCKSINSTLVRLDRNLHIKNNDI